MNEKKLRELRKITLHMIYGDEDDKPVLDVSYYEAVLELIRTELDRLLDEAMHTGG